MDTLTLFLPCAGGVEDYLAAEVSRITGLPLPSLSRQRGGVQLHGSFAHAMQLNLHSRLAQRVLVQLAQSEYRNEQDLYQTALAVRWEEWFTPKQSIKVQLTAQHSPLTSLNFAALKIKDAVCDHLRACCGGLRPDVDTQRPDVRIHAHLSAQQCQLYIDTSGEPLFKRGWREDTGAAPLKETLAAALIAACGWAEDEGEGLALYDPCCGSGTLLIEAAQIARRIAAGAMRRFAFENYLPLPAAQWQAMKAQAAQAVLKPGPAHSARIYGSDVSHRMVDFAQRNARRAGVADSIEFRGGDALQRLPPCPTPGLLLLNPPYGERIETAGFAGQTRRGARELARSTTHREPPQDGDFFSQLATHWKKNYSGWTAWLLSPDPKLPSKMRLKESRRVPMWNGPIECRLFKFELVQGSARGKVGQQELRQD